MTYELIRFRRVTGSSRLALHAADTLLHACIDFLTYSDDHPSRQSGLCPSGERLGSNRRDVELMMTVDLHGINVVVFAGRY